MFLYGIIGILILVIIILIVKLSKKQIIDRNEYTTYQNSLNQLINEKNNLQKELTYNQNLLTDYQDKILTVQNKYREELNKKTEDLNVYFEHQKNTRQSEMDTDFERLLREKEENLEAKYNKMAYEELEKEEKFKQQTQEIIEAAKKSQDNILADTLYQQQRFEALLEPLKQYEMKQQERLFYTIQVPDEYKDDINFLVTTVSQKVQHPDIINKLVWAEYVKPYIDGTFKRACIEDKPGIYKITNIDSGKCYIGKSTNVKKRITDHFKSSIGIKTIADQTVHHEIWKTGFWNWTIEVIIYCDKEQLNELEKYYIDFFKSNEFGFNKTKGGEG
jgi:hypothetical protein